MATYKWVFDPVNNIYQITTSASVDYAYDTEGTYDPVLHYYATTTAGPYDEYTLSSSILINPLPIPYNQAGPPVVGNEITFIDNNYPNYFPSTIASAVWNFGDGNTSAVYDLLTSIAHTYLSPGIFTLELSAFDISGNTGVGTLEVLIFLGSNCKAKEDYITICGPEMVGRFGDCREINLVEYLPLYLRGGEAEEFLILFEEFLNNMYSGLCGWQTTSAELSVNQNWSVINSGTASAQAQQDFSYDISGTSAFTDATNVERLRLNWPTNASYPTSAQKISILEKVARLTELHDPSLIDIEYIQFFAANLGYSINVSRDEVGVSGTTENFGTDFQGACSATDINKYLRFVVENLPTWYKIKTTRNSMKVMLYSFGLVGDLIEYFTDNYKQTSAGGQWRAYVNGDLQINNDWFPTPHFAVYINFDLSTDISFEVARRTKVVRAIESIRPINTVFRRLIGYVSRRFDLEVACYMRATRYTVITSNGYSNTGTIRNVWTP